LAFICNFSAASLIHIFEPALAVGGTYLQHISGMSAARLFRSCINGAINFSRSLRLTVQLKYEWLAKRELGIKLVISSDTDYPEYDAFEKSVDKYFNSAYFESLCSGDPSTKWLLNFVDEHCPASMTQDYCALSATKKATCDTSYSDLDSENCPSETLCAEGTHLGCPYHKCRVQILEELFAWAG
jgi:hypothetical protein